MPGPEQPRPPHRAHGWTSVPRLDRVEPVDDTEAAHFGVAARRDGHGDGFFVDVQTEVMHLFAHECLVSLLCYHDPAPCRVSHIVDRSALADNPRSQPESHPLDPFVKP